MPIGTDTKDGVFLVESPPDSWFARNVSAAAGTATVTQAAPAQTKGPTRLVITQLTVAIAAGAAAQGPLTAQLKDGDGAVKWAGVLAAPANGGENIPLSGLRIPMPANKSAILEFTGAGAANTLQSVSMSGYEEIAPQGT